MVANSRNFKGYYYIADPMSYCKIDRWPTLEVLWVVMCAQPSGGPADPKIQMIFWDDGQTVHGLYAGSFSDVDSYIKGDQLVLVTWGGIYFDYTLSIAPPETGKVHDLDMEVAQFMKDSSYEKKQLSDSFASSHHIPFGTVL